MSIAVKSTCAPASSFVSKLVVVAMGGDTGGRLWLGGGRGKGGEVMIVIIIEGFSTIVMPSALEAAAVVPRFETREVCIASAVVDAGTAMVAVMITLPGAMAMATSAVLTPAALAKIRCTLEVSGKSSMLPLAVSVTTISAVEGGAGAGCAGGGVDGGSCGAETPHTSLKSKRHPVPAVQPPASSAAVQSLAPAAWQMASASAKVLSRVHGQPASDSPHTEQPFRRDPQAGESLTSEQQRTWPRVGAW